MNNINDTYFDGYYKQIWKTYIPEELTVKEIDFMVPFFNLLPGSKVLDLMCGYGRHTIALARKGIEVTAVDNLDDYITELTAASKKETLPVHTIKSGALDFTTEKKFDLAICMGNSLNFFNAGDTLTLLTNTASQLKPGGHFLINSWSLAEIVIKNFKSNGWGQVGDLKILSNSKFLFHPARIESENIIIAPDGTTETKTAIDYIFSVNEIETMLTRAGFILKDIYSIPGKKKFTLNEPRAYIVAQKI